MNVINNRSVKTIAFASRIASEAPFATGEIHGVSSISILIDSIDIHSEI
jgi:hypothetical protein